MKVYEKHINHTKVSLIFNTSEEAKDFFDQVELIQKPILNGPKCPDCKQPTHHGPMFNWCEYCGWRSDIVT